MKNYFVVTKAGEDVFQSVRTERELAELWQLDSDCGAYDSIEAWEYVNGGLQAVNVYEVATAFLKEQDEMRKEYEDYCETVSEYGYDYYEDQDALEMGFDPYMGSYSDDC